MGDDFPPNGIKGWGIFFHKAHRPHEPMEIVDVAFSWNTLWQKIANIFSRIEDQYAFVIKEVTLKVADPMDGAQQFIVKEYHD